MNLFTHEKLFYLVNLFRDHYMMNLDDELLSSLDLSKWSYETGVVNDWGTG